VLTGPAWIIAGTTGLEGLSIAAGLCLVPGFVTFAIASRYRQNHTQVAMVFLVGSTLRLLFVLVGMLVVRAIRPDLGFREFVIWLLAFYLTTLTTETLMMLKQKPASDARPRENGC